MAAPGRGSAFAVALLLLALFCVDRARAVSHTVGGTKGWDLSVDYKSWAAGETFKVGDVLFFPYDSAAHDVVVVDKAGYDACSDANAIATYNKGNENLTLTTTGLHYYLCSLPGHCSYGMKLAITVEAAAAGAPAPAKTAASPAPTKAAPPPAPTKKAPSPAPAPPSPAPAPPSPASVPNPAPASASTPVSAPAPASPSPAPGIEPPAPSPAPSSAPITPASPPSPTTTTSPSSPPSLQSPPSAAPALLASASALTLLPLLASLLAL